MKALVAKMFNLVDEIWKMYVNHSRVDLRYSM